MQSISILLYSLLWISSVGTFIWLVATFLSILYGVICSGRRQGELLFKIMGCGIERGVWQTVWNRQGPPLSAPNNKV